MVMRVIDIWKFPISMKCLLRLLPISSMIIRELIYNDKNDTKQRRKLTYVPFDFYVSADSCKMSH